MKLSKLGVWAGLDGMTAAAALDFARQVEAWGFSALWAPEGTGRDVLVDSAWLLAGTHRLIVASGIANLYARDAMAMAAARNQLNEQSGGRFLLGIGLSHARIVGGVRGHEYGKPIGTMRAYLGAMARAPYSAPRPAERPQTVLAALGPQMIALSGELSDGAHTYNVTPAHTREARSILGPGKLLCVEQKVLLESDPARARHAARNALAAYLTLENYKNSWRHGGYQDADFEGGGSDRLIDALVVWGDFDTIIARLQQHWDAGADHVCVQSMAINSLATSGLPQPDLALLERLSEVC